MRSNFLVLVVAGLVSLNCGGMEEEETNTPPAPKWINKKPTLLVASPGAMAVGDEMTILGQDFVTSAHGKVMIRFTGTFFDAQGNTNKVDYQATPTMLNSGKVKWSMWPNIIFDKTGNHLGRFVGQVVALNMGKDGSKQYSDSMPLTVDIKPSIIPRTVRPTGTGCSNIVGATLENQGMAFAVEVVGLRPASQDSPLDFYWTFMASQWKVAFDYGSMNPSSVAPKTGAFMLEDSVTSGNISALQDGGPRHFLLKVKDDLVGNARLKELKTGIIPSQGNSMPVSVNVAVVDASGKSAKLAIKLIVNRSAELVYSGENKLVERFPPVMVSDCIPGGDIGREVSYHESKSESRSRSLAFNWNVGVGGNIAPIPSNPFALGINFNVGFGMNIHEQVSSDKQKSLSISGRILPGEFSAFYRQTTKIHRIAKIIRHTVCGLSGHQGNAVLTDWIFTPDMASGTSCPPPTNLQPAQKFVQ